MCRCYLKIQPWVWNKNLKFSYLDTVREQYAGITKVFDNLKIVEIFLNKVARKPFFLNVKYLLWAVENAYIKSCGEDSPEKCRNCSQNQ